MVSVYLQNDQMREGPVIGQVRAMVPRKNLQ